MLQVTFGFWEEEKNPMMHHPKDYDFGLTLANISIACVVFMAVTALQSDREMPLFLGEYLVIEMINLYPW